MTRVLIYLFVFFWHGIITSYYYYIGDKQFVFWILPTMLFYGMLIVELFKLKNK
jgi:hypothetical protein